tara:strand:- start:1789 stop:2079 length:291 start_codon:yes stop_codon:yes gene_type:complete
MSNPRGPEKSIVVIDVIPADSEISLDELIAKIHKIELEDLTWGNHTIQDFMFGMKKIQLSCQITDKVSVDNITNGINALGEELVGDVSIVSFNRDG